MLKCYIVKILYDIFKIKSLEKNVVCFRNFEDVDNHDCYDIAYRTKSDCEVVYPCPFSLLKLLLYNLYTEETWEIAN